MIEIVALSVLSLSIAACLFSSFQQKSVLDKLHIPEDSTLRRHFLTHLWAENLLLAMEVEKRLAKAK